MDQKNAIEIAKMKRYQDMQDKRSEWKRMLGGRKRKKNTAQAEWNGMRQMAFEEKVHQAGYFGTQADNNISRAIKPGIL